jgi:hypothetical protein
VGLRSAERREGWEKPPVVSRRLGDWRRNEGRLRPTEASGAGQCAQARGLPVSSAVRNDDPHPQAATAFGLFTVNPAPISVST